MFLKYIDFLSTNKDGKNLVEKVNISRVYYNLWLIHGETISFKSFVWFMINLNSLKKTSKVVNQ